MSTTFNAGAIEANLTLGRSDWTKDLKKTYAEMRKLEQSTINIDVDLDTSDFVAGMVDIRTMAEQIEGTYTPEVDLITREAEASLAALKARLEELDASRYEVEVGLDRGPMSAELLEAKAQLAAFENDPAIVEVLMDSDQFERKYIEIATATNRLDGSDIDINVDLNGYPGAIARMNTLQAQVAFLDGQDIDIDVNMDRSALAGLVGSGGGGGGGGGGRLGLLRILLYSILALSPVLAVSMGALTATIVGFSAALAGAIGPVAVLGLGLAGLVARFNEMVEEGGTLPPFMQAFADSIDAVKDAYSDFLDAIAPAGFELMADALNLVADILPTLAPLFNATADALGGVLDGIAGFVDSSEYDEMLDFFGGFGVDMLVSFLQIGGNLLRFFGRLFQAIEPFAREMMQGLEDLTAGWMEWADDLENNDAFQQFMDRALEYGPQVLDMLGSLLDAFMNIGEALEPFAGPMLDGLIFMFDMIANMDPNILSALIAAFAGLWLGLNVLAPAISAVSGALTVLTTALGVGVAPILIIGGLIAGLAAIVWHLWETNETFRDAVIDTWEAIRDTVGPIVEDIADYIRENWEPIKEDVMEVFGAIEEIVVSAMIIIKQITRGTMAVISEIWRVHGEDILQIATGMFQLVWGQIKFFFQLIAGVFKFFAALLRGDWRGMWEAIKGIGAAFMGFLESRVRAFKNIFGGVWSALSKYLTDVWSRGTEAIKQKWNDLKGFLSGGFSDLVGMVSGLGSRIKTAASGMWDSIKSGFVGIINDIIGLWNNLSFSVDIPDKIPGLPDSFTVSTPNVPYLAEGGWIDKPTLAMVGEGREPEIVTPESKMERIVREQAGGTNIDYGMLAAAVATALAEVMSKINFRIDPEDLDAILRGAGADIKIDASADEGSLVQRLIAGLSFEMRRLGYGGVRNV